MRKRRCDRVNCRRFAVSVATIVTGFDLFLCETHYELWKSGNWYKGLPKKVGA